MFWESVSTSDGQHSHPVNITYQFNLEMGAYVGVGEGDIQKTRVSGWRASSKLNLTW
jgi:hypothetical protein